MKEPGIPAARLYKIMPPERLESLGSLEFRFTPLTDLNDPYDLRPSMSNLRQAVIEEVRKLTKRKPPPSSEDFLAVLQRYVFEFDWDEVRAALKLVENNPVAMALHACSLFEGFEQATKQDLEEFGVFSLTRTLLSSTMWSHYGGNHEGFAVEFSGSKLEEWVGGKLKQRLPFWGMAVEYCESRSQLPSFNADPQNGNNFIELMFCNKSKAWEPEEEERLVARLNCCNRVVTSGTKLIHLFAIPEELVTGVYLGARCPATCGDAKLMLQQRPGRQHIQVRRLCLSESDYGLALDD